MPNQKKENQHKSAYVHVPTFWSLLYPILYRTIPYHTIPYHTIPYHTIPYHTIPYHTILYYTILCYAILYYTILYYTILYYTILYYTILYYAILDYTDIAGPLTLRAAPCSSVSSSSAIGRPWRCASPTPRCRPPLASSGRPGRSLTGPGSLEYGIT